MKNFPLYIILHILFTIVVTCVRSASWTVPANKRLLKGRLGVCFESNYHFGYMTHGKNKTSYGDCVNVVCSGYDSSITYMECGTLECEDEKNDGDHSKPYPWCCPFCID